MKARFVRLGWENAAQTIGTLYFKPDKPFYFTAGQYTGLTVPHSPADSRGLTRTMTIVSEPSDQLIGITTRFSDRPQSTYKQALLALRPGDAVTLSDAMGDLVLPLDESIPLVFVAGGVGIASYSSMLRYLTRHKDARHITLLYAVRSNSDVIFQDILDEYSAVGTLGAALFTTAHGIDASRWNGAIKSARLTAKDIMAALKPNSQIYLSGGQSMVESLRRELETVHEIEHYRIVFDYFDGYVET